METGSIRAWERELAGALNLLQKKRADLDVEISQVTKKYELVRQMLALEAGGTEPPTADGGGGTTIRTTPAEVREAVRIVLSEAAQPLHINAIHQQFKQRGYSIPGAGTPFNILVHLAKAPEFVRVARGTYALAGSVPDADVLQPRPRTPRRRKAPRNKGSRG